MRDKTNVGEMIGPSEPSPLPDPLCQRRFAGAKITTGDDHVPTLEQLRQPRPQSYHGPPWSGP